MNYGFLAIILIELIIYPILLIAFGLPITLMVVAVDVLFIAALQHFYLRYV
jgi:hypothetical protein